MKFSIIVPTYNSEDTIERCINSILNQTYSDFELIIINDGSTDNTENICMNLVKKYKKVKFITQENKGVSAARNKGIYIAHADYITFVDSDDYLEENFLENMNNILKQEKYDFIITGLKCTFGRENKSLMKIESEKFLNKQNISEILNREYYQLLACPVAKLYKLEILKRKNIYFDEKLVLGEDTCFVLDYIKQINNLFIKKIYNYIVVKDNNYNPKYADDIFEVQMKLYQKYKETVKFFNKNNGYQECEEFLIRSILITINNTILFKKNKKDYIEICNKITTNSDFMNITLINKNKWNTLIILLLKKKKYYLLRNILILKNIVLHRGRSNK